MEQCPLASQIDRAVYAALTPPVEPTISLGGREYVFEQEELVKAGPEFAQIAFYETWRHLWQVVAEYRSGTIDADTFQRRATDLYFGAYHLRDLIPGKERLVANGPFTATH